MKKKKTTKKRKEKVKSMKNENSKEKVKSTLSKIHVFNFDSMLLLENIRYSRHETSFFCIDFFI
jgi:3-phosphoglycerate kinase